MDNMAEFDRNWGRMTGAKTLEAAEEISHKWITQRRAINDDRFKIVVERDSTGWIIGEVLIKAGKGCGEL